MSETCKKPTTRNARQPQPRRRFALAFGAALLLSLLGLVAGFLFPAVAEGSKPEKNQPPAEIGLPASGGDFEQGEVVLQLVRGAAQPFELTVVKTPNDCQGSLTLHLRWNERANRVWVELSGAPGSLEPFPDVDRTLGVNFVPNPFFAEPEDVEDGRYQLWLISAAGPLLDFYYSGETLDLVGSQVDFPEGPPAGTIPAQFPTLYMFATPTFQPRADGSVNLKWSFPYDQAHRGDRPEFSHHVVTFPPPNLCGANLGALHLSTLRPYISAPLPREQARSWSDYLRGGLLFDVTIEPAEYFSEPPTTTLTATYSGATAIGGNVPKGYTFDIAAAFAGVAPPIKPWPGAEGDGCFDYYAPLFTSNINFCE